MNRLLRIFTCIFLLGTFILSLSSCEDDNAPGNSGFGIITGTVTGNLGAPLADVTVTVSGINEEDQTTTTNSDGTYTFEDVSIKLHAVTFSKTDWLTTSKSVAVKDFDAERVATVNISMVEAKAKITGTVLDAKNGNVPLAGATVSIGGSNTVQTGADGKFLFESLVKDNYTVTFTKTNYVTQTRTLTAASFISDVATLNINLGGQELLRGLTKDDLVNAEKWYYNEYRGGGNADAYPHWDWSVDYMCTLDFRGTWQEQNEGTTLQIRNAEGVERTNPANTDVFDSFVFGSKAITADNKIMSLRLRTHGSEDAIYGVQVVDLSEAQPTAVKIGGNKSLNSGSYVDVEFDLSAYVGKEVIIAIGTYRAATGDYWRQLVIRAIRFADQKVSNWDWLPGAKAIEGWELPMATVRSTMPQTKKSFSGITTGSTSPYSTGYRSWRTNNHVGAEWHFVPLKKDPEVFPSEGYLIKTRNTGETSTTVPEAYLYAKFAIAAGNNQLTFTTRTFGGNYTYFKLTAIEDDGTVTHIDPTSNTAVEASAAADGCWRFKNDRGDNSSPQLYADFVYDLSQFNGKNVTIAIGVYNGVANSGENKLVFRSINLN